MTALEWAGVVAVGLATGLFGGWAWPALVRWRNRRWLARLRRRIAAGEDEVSARREWMRERYPARVAVDEAWAAARAAARN
jgi:hypothetical protein